MEIELQLGIVSPGKELSLVITPIHDDPVETESHDAIQKNLRQENEKPEAALGAPRQAALIVSVVSKNIY